MNPMKQIKIEKLTFNVGAGTNQELLKKGMKLIKNLTGKEPVKTITNKRIPTWGIRPGLPIGCKLTIRNKEEIDNLLKRLLAAKENKLKRSNFDKDGNLSFGIHEYINVPGLEYDAEIGIIGFEVTATVSRPGYRVKYRRKCPSKIGKKHKITKEESIAFFKERYNVIVEE
ncbi:MAG: 50S ribosomal protein L5 [Candidatus Woesearchaeota archaeon]